MKRWKVWLGVLIIFFAGLAVGGVGTAIVVRKIVREVITGKARLSKGPFFDKLSRELSLSGAQKKEISLILSNTDEELILLRQQHRPKLIKIYKKTVSKVSSKLNQAQKNKFNKFVKKQSDLWKDE
ncbi:MAG: hypothetical protein QNJ31_08565 [Candidatus Caenarcaniphilales bacterium]|nr:hypothetical protein [Candidatus Caenarcaniphilales bacterium]